MKPGNRKTKRKQSSLDSILSLFLEAGLLKRIRRSGWWVVGLKNPESVAEHSFRTALIGYCLAKKEDVNAYPVLLMTLFNDLQEARINDLHKMGQRYIDFSQAEDKVFKEQIKNLPQEIKKELRSIQAEYRLQKSKESILARDADILECLLQAKEYYEQGYRLSKNFFKKAPAHLKTRSARLLWQSIKKARIDKWWMRLTEFKR